MIVTRQLKNGLTFQVEASTEVELFRQLAKFEETFGEKSCGLCGKEDLSFSVRKSTAKEGKNKGKTFEYFEIKCNTKNCGGVLSMGQHNNAEKTMFPNRKLEDGKYDYQHRGWHKFSARKDDVESPESAFNAD